MPSSKVLFFKRQIKRDLKERNIEITRELLLTLLATNAQFHTPTAADLTEAIKLIWEETFNSQVVEIFGSMI